LASFHSDHGFVEERYSSHCFSPANKNAALPLQAHRREIFVVKTCANSRRFNKRVIGCHHVALTNCTDTRRQHRVPLFDAVPFALEQTSRAGEPATSLSQLALQNRCKTEPACSPSR